MFSAHSVATTLSVVMSIVRRKCKSTKKSKCAPPKANQHQVPPSNAQIVEQNVEAQSEKLNSSNSCKPNNFNSALGTIKKLFATNKPSGKIQNSWRIDSNELKHLKLIGSGAQGKVFSAVYHGKKIAFKKVSTAKGINLDYIKKLSHPNVVRFYGACVDGPDFGLVMELCARRNLHDEIYTRNLIEPQTILRWVADIASGMNYLHYNGIVHRDLKPQNILLEEGLQGSLKIADFDISRKIGKHASTVTFAGTVAYMAPEVLRQVSLTFKVDVWAYGVVLWEILTRRTPYGNFNELAIIYGVGLNTLRLQIPSNCPMSFRRILTACLQKVPSKRPSFEKILTLLRRAATHHGDSKAADLIRKEIAPRPVM